VNVSAKSYHHFTVTPNRDCRMVDLQTLTTRAQNVILQKLSFYRGILDLFGRASKPIPLQFLLMGFSIMILLLRHSIRGHTFNSLFHDIYACVAIIGSGDKRSSG